MSNEVAFVANGVPITVGQRDAAMAIMACPRFTTLQMEMAMIAAGVPNTDFTVERASDRLRQKERKAGRIRSVKGTVGLWERIA